MAELVGIKVKIGMRPNGHADHPKFNRLPVVQASGMDWSKYVDVAGLGWHYDKTSGHKEETLDSPRGQQWGVLIVPEQFAAEAIAEFPDLVTELTEVELEDFHDNKARAHLPDEEVDVDILTGIKLKQDLGIPLTEQQQKALDPDDDTRGIVKSKRKKWADRKIRKGITIKATPIERVIL